MKQSLLSNTEPVDSEQLQHAAMAQSNGICTHLPKVPVTEQRPVPLGLEKQISQPGSWQACATGLVSWHGGSAGGDAVSTRHWGHGPTPPGGLPTTSGPERRRAAAPATPNVASATSRPTRSTDK